MAPKTHTYDISIHTWTPRELSEKVKTISDWTRRLFFGAFLPNDFDPTSNISKSAQRGR